jgi:hypothetical protein
MPWFGAEMSALFVVGGTMGSWLVSNLIPLAICSAAAVIIGSLVIRHELTGRIKNLFDVKGDWFGH